MRVAALATLVLVAACSDSDESRPPVASLRPAGSGWACFRDRVPDLSVCARPDACEPTRQAYVTEKDRSAEDYDVTPCTARTGVACFTAYFVVAKRSGFLCLETMAECQGIVGSARGSADYRDVSDCGAW